MQSDANFSQSSTRNTRRRLVAMAALALLVVVLDQISKAWIRANVAPFGELALWPNVVHLTHVLNRGAAWSMLSGQRWLLVFITLAVVAGLLAAARTFVKKSVLGAWSFGFILGGAVGNLMDRIAHGAVTDMIDMDTSWRWLRNFPVFNLADSALTLGVILLLIHTIRGEKTVANAATLHTSNR